MQAPAKRLLSCKRSKIWATRAVPETGYGERCPTPETPHHSKQTDSIRAGPSPRLLSRILIYPPSSTNPLLQNEGADELERDFEAIKKGGTVTDAQLAKLWDLFDKDGNGVLGPTGANRNDYSEIRSLHIAVLKAQRALLTAAIERGNTDLEMELEHEKGQMGSHARSDAFTKLVKKMESDANMFDDRITDVEDNEGRGLEQTKRMHDRFDTDGDGILTKKEFLENARTVLFV